jgi:hypothetical protein
MKSRLRRSTIAMYGNVMFDNTLFGLTTTLISGLLAALSEVVEVYFHPLDLNVPMRLAVNGPTMLLDHQIHS